jgi:hypothetical protein
MVSAIPWYQRRSMGYVHQPGKGRNLRTRIKELEWGAKTHGKDDPCTRRSPIAWHNRWTLDLRSA